MIINKINNYYIIKLPNSKMNIYDQSKIEELTKKIIIKINKNYKLNNYIDLEFYINNHYGIIIKLTDYKSPFIIKNDKTVKITIHTDSIFLYQVDYIDIKKRNIKNKNAYYYKNKIYIEVNKEIDTNDYIKLLELSEIIFEDTLDIIDKGIKI